jgi:hypothetical protein
MKRTIQNGFEAVVIIILATMPPRLAEAWYGINWWLAAGVTLAILYALAWLEQRTPEGHERGLFKPFDCRRSPRT